MKLAAIGAVLALSLAAAAPGFAQTAASPGCANGVSHPAGDGSGTDTRSTTSRQNGGSVPNQLAQTAGDGSGTDTRSTTSRQNGGSVPNQMAQNAGDGSGTDTRSTTTRSKRRQCARPDGPSHAVQVSGLRAALLSRSRNGSAQPR